MGDDTRWPFYWPEERSPSTHFKGAMVMSLCALFMHTQAIRATLLPRVSSNKPMPTMRFVELSGRCSMV